MGLRSDIAALASFAESSMLGTSKGEVGIRSPWAGDLTRIVVDDLVSLFEDAVGTECLTRAQAMQLPGVYRARGILLSLIADKPLLAWRGLELLPVEATPSFLYQTPGVLGPWQRMIRTIDDHIFYPYSLWLTVRGAESAGRKPILSAVHCPWESWRINEAGMIELANSDGGWDVADEDEVILIPGPSEGLLAYATRTLLGSRALDAAWVSRAKTPAPLTELHITDDTQLDDDEMLATRDAWVTARRQAEGSVAMTPSNIEVKDHGQADPALFIEGRNAGRLDIAAFFNLPGSVLDASTATASLTYVTQEGNRSSLDDMSLPYWYRPIESRLSQDDIVPHGQSVRFDFSSRATAAIATED
jgi:hypothetical protein